MTSLDRSTLREISAGEPLEERAWAKIPLLGRWVAHSFWMRRARPIRRRLIERLEARGTVLPTQWGDDPVRLSIATTVCQVAKEEMGWPSAAFLPEDSFAVVFWSFEDGLDDVAAMMALEDRFGLDLSPSDIEAFVDRPLGEFVDTLVERISVQKD